MPKAIPGRLPGTGDPAMAALRQAGNHFRAGDFLAAAEIYRDVIRREPRKADLHNNLGVALKAAGHVTEAVPCFRRAVRLKRDYAVAHANLAGSLEALGKPVDALEHRVEAWRINPDALEQRDALIGALRRCPFDKPNAQARSALSALFERTDIDKQMLSSTAIRLWSAIPAVRKALDIAARTYPSTLGEIPRGFKPVSEFLADPLLIAALRDTVAADPSLEAEIAFSRRWLLDRFVAGERIRIDPPWLPALALQARIAEWVWKETGHELQQLAAMDAAVDQEAEAREPNRTRVLIRALYRPIETDPMAVTLRTLASRLPYAETLPFDVRENDWDTLLRRSFLHRHTEETLMEDIRTLTAIADDTSARVRAQYEESPYPRWLSVGIRPKRTLEEHLVQLLPSAPIGPIAPRPIRILVAGCGTGRHAIQTALRYRDAEVTAVDLSRASLAYGKRMAREMEIRNISFFQGDILALDRIPNRFDLIESSGVLHHMADPLAGWKALRSRLAKGGFMRLAFYSGRARSCFDEIRAAAPPKPASLAHRVAAVRHAVYALPETHPGRALLRTADFYATSGVRDALLHEQETTVDLDWIDRSLSSLDLRFLGFELPDPAWLVEYCRRNPEDAAGLDLRAWDSVEAAHPDLFLGMYQFWVRDDLHG